MPAAAKAGTAPTTDRPLADWHEFQRRAPTEEELTTWFSDGRFNMGTVIPASWLVVDFDGGKAAEALLVAAGVVLPENTPRVMSGSGGYHAYLRLPAGVRDFAKVPGAKFLHATDADGKPCKPFVEILTINNFVVLPPSIHPNGKAYEWVVDLDGNVPEVPASLLELIARKRGSPTENKTVKTAKNGNKPGWVEELSKGTGPGTHDDSMTKLAGHYLRKRLSVVNVIDIISSGYGRRSWQVPGVPYTIPLADIKRVVESVARAESRRSELDESEFQCLGYDHEIYYYLSRSTGQVVELTARGHDKNNLLRLASMRYWESKFGGEHGVAWQGAQSFLMEAQHKVGIFDHDRFRGRGAWWDEEAGAVMHTGDFLIANERSSPIRSLLPGRYVYEMSKSLDVSIGDPLDVAAARQVLEIFESLSWEHPHHARLAAGWCVVATVCGAVEWRPHVWISGPSGSGKSWTVDHLVKRLLGNLALSAQSTTTEAGLRQTLGHDARPVVFDEAEADGQRDDARMANVLGLIRQASSETGGAILKGSADGMARTYRIRSCFAMSSINVSAYQAADRNRISILEMKVPDGEQTVRDAAFGALCARVADVFTDRYVDGFRARCIRMIPTIRANARVFAVAASGRIGSRRLGDQVGTLLAGCYSLLSDEPVTAELAAELLSDQDLSQQQALKEENDEQDLLDYILQSVQRVALTHGMAEKSVSTLLRAVQHSDVQEINPRDAIESLALVGIKSTADGVVIANSHKGVRALLTGTHWGKDWSRVLRRLHGAELSGVVRIGDGVCRGVLVPWECVKLRDKENVTDIVT
jgi:putative DNA primase/helicase